MNGAKLGMTGLCCERIFLKYVMKPPLAENNLNAPKTSKTPRGKLIGLITKLLFNENVPYHKTLRSSDVYNPNQTQFGVCVVKIKV